MKLNSKCFLLAALMVWGFVSGASAAEKWTGIKCNDEYPEPSYPDEIIQTFTKVCYISQFGNQDEAIEKGFRVGDLFSVWSGTGGFREKLNNEIQEAMQICSGDGLCYGFELRFETDLDLGGFEVSNGDTVCVSAFDPVLIPVDVLTNYVTEINGNGKTIKGYCDIGQGDKSFFKGVQSFGTPNEVIVDVQNARFIDIHFDSAYVKATGVEARAAVVADTVTNISFDNISVTNSIVSSSYVAAGIVACYGAETSSTYSVQVDATLRGQIVGGVFGRAEFSSMQGSSAVNGISVDVQVLAAEEGDAVTAGGFAGVITGVQNPEFTFGGDTVSLVVPNGADNVTAGGLVGSLMSSTRGTTELRNLSNKIDLFVNSTGYATYAGGLVGKVSFENVLVTDSLNDIHAVVAAKGTPDPETEEIENIISEVYAGGEFGMIQRASGLRVAHDNVDARLVAAGAEAQFFGGVAGAVAATKTLAVAQSDVKASIASSGEGEINVAMGGLFGSVVGPNANQGGTMEVVCDADTVTVSMQAASTGVVYAGGLVGVANGGERGAGGFYSYMSTVKAPEGSNLITVSSSTVKKLFAGGLAGQVTSPRDLIKFYRARVVGDIDVPAATIADSGAVGGLFGEFNSYRVFIFDNLSEGDILAGADNVGFAVGKVLSRQNDADGVMLTSNVHIGTKDVNVKQVLGTMILGGETVTDWDEGESYAADFHYSITHNYRNAIASENTPLVSTGVLDIDGSGFVNAKDARLLNGVLDESTMKSRLLAYVLTQKENRASGGETNVEDDYTCWENDNGEFVHVCGEGENRTAYKVELDIQDIVSKFTDADKESLEGILDSVYAPEDDYTEYTLVTYTEKDRRVSPDFVKRIRALSVDFGVFEETYEIDLETYPMWQDVLYQTEENSSFVVVYETAVVVVDQPAASYGNLDETLPYPVYLWPKVTKVRRYNEHAVIPPVFVMNDGTKVEYGIDSYYINCREGGNCDVDKIDGELGDTKTFARIMEDIAGRYGPEYSDTIHLIYAPIGGISETPTMALGVSGNHAIMYTAYGYKDGLLAQFDTASAGYFNNPSVPMASKYSIAADAGFILKKWKADFWAHMTGYRNIEECYEEGQASEECSKAVTFETTKNYFAEPSSIKAAFMDNMENGSFLKWSAEFDADGVVDMDSVIAAIVGMGDMLTNDFHYYYLLHAIPELEAIPYAISFDVNAADMDVFVAGYTDTLAIYSRETYETAALPMLYTTDTTRCFGGWSVSPDKQDFLARELDADVLNAVEPVDNVFSLYGSWNNSLVTEADGQPGKETYEMGGCDNIENSQISLHYQGDIGPEGGKVYLWQKLVNPVDTLTFRHDFEDSTMAIPGAWAFFRFHVGAESEPGYALSHVKFVRGIMENADAPSGEADTIDVAMQDGDGVIEFYSGSRSPELLVEFSKFISVAFDLNTKQEDVFYDLDFVQGDSLKVLNNDDQVRLPAWIYTANSCVLGWSAEKDAEIHTYRAMTWSSELYEKLQDTQKLYAVWGDAEQCVESARYARVKAVAENGRIELLEGEGEPRVHSFGEGSIILPPEQYTGGFRVRAIPDDGYVLEKILLIQDGDTIPFENGEWLEGLVDGAEIRAYFIESAEPVVTDGAKFYQSGNAVRFTFHKDGFVKDGEASIRISLENDDGKELDGNEYRCTTDACDLEWERFPLAAGFYLFTASVVRDGHDSLLREQDFEVVAEIAIAGEKSWQMISLANVDMDKLSWDGDETFYWWAEDRNYGKYWQYQELVKSQTPEKERGYWYSSIEGRPLVLKDSAFADDITWNLTNENGGWNLVANPYGWQIELGVDEYDLDEPEEESEDNRKKRVPLVEYSRWNPEEGQYVPVSKLGPYQAVWAQLNRSMSTTIEIAARPSFDEDTNVDANAEMDRTLNRRFAKIGDASGWALQAMLSDGRGKKDSWNVLGVGDFARQSEEPPAGMGDHVNLSILDGGKRLMKSVKAAGEGASYEWNVDLTATSPRTGYLLFAGIDGLESRGLSVYVTVDGNTTRMREGEPLKVALSSEAKVATVFVGSAPKVALVKTLAGLKAVQAGATLQVDFDAGAGLAGSAVRVDVLDLKGNVVRSVASSALAGVNRVTLDAPKPGIYMLRVRAGSQMNAGRILVK
ncbi:Por secretion system C-terminal sorting domain-containing protein [Fibrobacter sp. UWT3]|uniref:T9SS type A sorting domain-containing protein n=1 Tax=Fibrobacter sp. UWT3 TaxID=1896225 RepID=UPI000BCF6CF1|nr:T9SS type A sorting domain-containing protein [Fibrobacter sp. UWT3]SOE79978.1 Por secretion system C-terminal sorting domain-containing protein [Fibrobacter sp. UWT3]